MDPPDQGFANLIQTQSRESADEEVAPLPTRSQLLHRNAAGADDAEWLRFNLLSLGYSPCGSLKVQIDLVGLIDGGGIRGYWTLLALQTLVDYIGAEEEREGIHHSFHPQKWPENVYQAPLTPEEEARINEAYDPEVKTRKLPRTRRYLPCHYFDHICGSSTGA